MSRWSDLRERGAGVRRRHGRALAAVLGLTIVGAVWALLSRDDPRLRPAPPALVGDSAWVPNLPPSTLEVPVVYDLSPIVEKLEGVVPQRYGSLDDRVELGSNERASAAFELVRSPFQAHLEGTVAHVAALVRYRGRAWYDPPVLPEVSASCGTGEDEPAPRVWIRLSAPLMLTSRWTLAADPRVDGVAAATDEERDRCQITPLQIDVTGRVIDAATSILEDSLPAIRRELASIDLKSHFEEWWRVLSEPIQLDDDIWLLIDPRAVHRGPISGDSLTLVATVGLIAHPRIVLGNRPLTELAPLPPLDSGDLRPGLHVRATALGDYRVGSRRLTQELAGTEITQAGRLLRIRSVSVRGIGGGRVSLEVAVGGAVHGRVFLVGTPRYDASSREIHVPDLDFDVATRDVLVGSLAWLAETPFVEVLRTRARWPVEDLVRFATEQLERGLNHRLGDSAQLRGTVDSVEILGVFPTRTALVVHAAARAQAALVVDEDGPASRSPPPTLQHGAR